MFLISRRTRSGSSTPGSSTMMRWFEAAWMIGSATPNSLMRLSIVCFAWVTASSQSGPKVKVARVWVVLPV